ncbi:MAG: radical SAM protein [Ruminococcaceae bacterium]|nr:radical SAM protein [Oscillospiraceae bacterium]
MKRTNLSIFIPHVGCPHKCSFCDQKSISGEVSAPRAAEVTKLLEEQAMHLAERGMCAEIAFFGGSFTAIPEGYMTELLEAAGQALRRYPEAYCGIRCSTRPDCISAEILDKLKNYGMTAVELGAQSMCDEVLKANRRGHTAEDVHRAARLIKESGLELGLQMMTGLYCDSREAVLYTAEEFIALQPATVRIYPTVILDGTHLGELYKSGVYSSFTADETIEICAQLLRRFTDSGIKVIRMGLHASADVEAAMLGGVYHPAFRELCESRLFLDDVVKQLSAYPTGSYMICTDPRNISRATGQKRCNIAALHEVGYDVTIKPMSGEYIKICEQTER